MVERTRRLRMGLAHSSPGASGDTARPNYVGPSGNGLVERMNAGESPRNQGRSVCRPPLSGSRSAVPRSKEKRRSGAPRGERPSQWACAARRIDVTRAFRRSAPLTFCEGAFPLMSRGDGNPGAPRALRKQGRRSFGSFIHGLLEM